MSEDTLLYGNVQQLTTEPAVGPPCSGTKRRMQEIPGPRSGAITEGPHAGSGIGKPANSSSPAPMAGMDWDAIEARLRTILASAGPDELLDSLQGWLVELRRARAKLPDAAPMTLERVEQIEARLVGMRPNAGKVSDDELRSLIRAWRAARAFVEYDGANDNPDYVHYQEHFDALAASVNAVPASGGEQTVRSRQ